MLFCVCKYTIAFSKKAYIAKIYKPAAVFCAGSYNVSLSQMEEQLVENITPTGYNQIMEAIT
ncbi:MAG: hypothetical protein LBD20_06800 [Spirochaetaceae bacterium]|jgi:hypothetical protein|nr:hypothetical protein [Spirochaetaceae bacterium]